MNSKKEGEILQNTQPWRQILKRNIETINSVLVIKLAMPKSSFVDKNEWRLSRSSVDGISQWNLPFSNSSGAGYRVCLRQNILTVLQIVYWTYRKTRSINLDQIHLGRLSKSWWLQTFWKHAKFIILQQ